jgi:hypothetical protein
MAPGDQPSLFCVLYSRIQNGALGTCTQNYGLRHRCDPDFTRAPGSDDEKIDESFYALYQTELPPVVVRWAGFEPATSISQRCRSIKGIRRMVLEGFAPPTSSV